MAGLPRGIAELASGQRRGVHNPSSGKKNTQISLRLISIWLDDILFDLLNMFITGNMWAQSWSNIYDILEPYPGMGRESLTNEMERQVATQNIK